MPQKLSHTDFMTDYIIAPDPSAARLTRAVIGVDEHGMDVTANVVEERPLTIFLNTREIVTAMTIGDYPDHLAVGFLRNQGMLSPEDVITGVDYDNDIDTVVVRTEIETNYEDKLARKTRTSGCAVGTVRGFHPAQSRGENLVAVCPRRQNQPHPVAVFGSRRHSRHRAVPRGSPAGLYGRRWPP